VGGAVRRYVAGHFMSRGTQAISNNEIGVNVECKE
jgi:hypothetical protein